jgi:hypothetical protein
MELTHLQSDERPVPGLLPHRPLGQRCRPGRGSGSPEILPGPGQGRSLLVTSSDRLWNPLRVLGEFGDDPQQR